MERSGRAGNVNVVNVLRHDFVNMSSSIYNWNGALSVFRMFSALLKCLRLERGSNPRPPMSGQMLYQLSYPGTFY